jgi:eukaryotic translation initiation factor 2C
MLVGIDVSHAEPGSTLESMAAVVASMDGRASQYVAHLSAQSSRVEMVQSLENAMKSLLETFKTKNRTMPAHIIVYRDGVSDGQFEAVIQQELPSIQNALTSMGYTDDSVKVSIVICQKGHHTRFAYEENVNGVKSLVNACPGLLVDATGGVNSVASASINEFYLNSHVAIQGTAKPCKYALIYDEIGFKLSELELLTYWSCYLYCRCNRSVSYATPAYYAHWASKRGKTLFAAGGTAGDLQAISSKWAEPGRPSTMFFL